MLLVEGTKLGPLFSKKNKTEMKPSDYKRRKMSRHFSDRLGSGQ